MMKISAQKSYCVNLYEESQDKITHNRTYTGELKFTGVELVGAIISAGMPDIYLTKNEKRKHKEEINFKIKLFETYVVSSDDGKLSFDFSRKTYLDSTEIGAINYWIGMILITLLGQKKYKYDFMVHLSMIGSFSSKIQIKKKPFMSVSQKATFKSPDLLAINTSKNTYGVFESKGYSDYNRKAIERGYDQAKSIERINGKSPNHRLVVMTQTGSKEIQMIEKDPEGEGCYIIINPVFLHLYYFWPIAELITELKPKENSNQVIGLLKHEEEYYNITLPLELYKFLLQLIEADNEEDIEKLIFERYSSENYLSDLISKGFDDKILLVEVVERFKGRNE